MNPSRPVTGPELC